MDWRSRWRSRFDSQVDAIIQEKDLERKFLLVRTLDDVYEGYLYWPHPHHEDVLPAIARLFDYALEYVFQDIELKKQQKSQVLRDIDEWIFCTLRHLIAYGIPAYIRTEHFHWEKLATVLPRLPTSLLRDALSLLGCSGNENYKPLLEGYLKYRNRNSKITQLIRETARDSLEDMEDSLQAKEQEEANIRAGHPPIGSILDIDWRIWIDAQVNAIIQEKDLDRKDKLLRELDDIFVFDDALVPHGRYYYPHPHPDDIFPAIALLFDYALEYVFQDAEQKELWTARQRQHQEPYRDKFPPSWYSDFDSLMFDTLRRGVGTSSTGNRIQHWDKLVVMLPQLSAPALRRALDLLGYSRNEKYKPVLESYLGHSDYYIRDAASRSLKVMESELEDMHNNSE